MYYLQIVIEISCPLALESICMLLSVLWKYVVLPICRIHLPFIHVACSANLEKLAIDA